MLIRVVVSSTGFVQNSGVRPQVPIHFTRMLPAEGIVLLYSFRESVSL